MKMFTPYRSSQNWYQIPNQELRPWYKCRLRNLQLYSYENFGCGVLFGINDFVHSYMNFCLISKLNLDLVKYSYDISYVLRLINILK